MDKVGNIIIRVMQDLSQLSTNGSAHIKINQSLCEPEEFETLFNYFSKGTLLEHLELEVDPLQAYMSCSCGHREPVEGDHPGYTNCPACGRFAEVEDSAYQLVKPDPDRAGRRKSIRF
ncbi:MAG: hydrogenase/urease maturation nickel metallochaperone HypA [Candidatus Nanohaloarchaea archaeon]